MAELNTVTVAVPDGSSDEVLQITNCSTVNYRLADVIVMAGQYTFSVWAKADAEMNVEFRVLGNVYTESVTTEWRKLVFTVDESSTTYIDICPAANTALYLYKGMLQQGQFDTDWKPAPEDTDSAIADAEERITKAYTSSISQTESSILATVEGTYATQDSVDSAKASLELSIEEKVGTDEIVSTLNASADEINLTGNRLVIESTYFNLAADGSITSTRGSIANWDIGPTSISKSTTKTDGDGTTSSYQYVFQAPSDGNGWDHVLYARHRASETDAWTFDFYLAYDGTFSTHGDLTVFGQTSLATLTTTGNITCGSVVYSGSFAADNNAGYYAKTTSGTNVKLMYLSPSDALNVGQSDVPLLLYGSSIAANKSISVSSDRRLKHDIVPLDARYDDLFDRLNPASYRYNDQPEREHVGLIAQEVEEALHAAGIKDSALVTEKGDGMLGLAYSELIGLLVKEVQMLKARVKALENGG